MSDNANLIRTGSRALLLALAALVAAPHAAAQIDWLSVTQDDSRMVSAPDVGLDDVEERDYAWADLDKDGWTDLVIVRRQPFMTVGPRVNVLFMNESGFLVDRTGLYATASDVAGDMGFQTPTNDRDVEIVDVDLDGWLDVVTATTLSPGYPKHISHPRVYVNLGNDVNGSWLGLRYEAARIPDFGTFPNFCGLGSGDVTGDGYPDLYFAHYDSMAAVDLNDRLLINDGTGHFTDESALRMTPQMLLSGFGSSADILDMNGDGAADVVKNTGIGISPGPARVVVSYNDPNNVGFFNILDTANLAQPYHVSAGDLNADGRPDLVTSDDFDDRYILNEGNDGLGRVKWSPDYKFGAPDDSFSNRNTIADIDGDGWNDVLVMDMDIIFVGCDRRLHIYHNQGGVIGGFVDIHEEVGGGYHGVEGMTKTDLGGTWDVGVFDIDGDGDNDLVVGRCGGTDVWMNEPSNVGTNYCDPAVPNSTGLPGTIGATGSELVADNDLTLTAVDLPPNQFGFFLASLTQGFVANPGGSQGNLCLGGTIGRFTAQVQSSGGAGTFSIPVDLGAMPPPLGSVQPGDTWSFQAWYRDVNPTPTSNFTNGVAVTFQ